MEKKNIEWKSGRIVHDIIADLEKMKLDIMKMCCEDYDSIDLTDTAANPSDKIRYKNYIVPGDYEGMPSNVSIDATAVLMCSWGEFPVPPEIMAYVKDAYDQGRINEKKLPNNTDLLERGKELLQVFLDKGIPYYSACAIVGATYVECGWNVHVANQLELNHGGVGGTGGWSNCGEGLFGLTFWSQKKKVMDKLMLAELTNITQEEYERQDHKHLCDCTESEWVDILEAYLDTCVKKHKDVLYNDEPPATDEDRTKILCSGYLFKAAGGLDPTFDNVKETTAKYMKTHENQAYAQSVLKAKRSGNPKEMIKTVTSGSSNYQAYDGFALQIYISMFLDKYLHGNVEDPDELGFEQFSDIIRSGANMNAQDITTYSQSLHQANGTNPDATPSNANYKKNPRYWNSTVAAAYAATYAHAASQHECAKFVRKAIEAGGLSTYGRPNWAWEYMHWLPTIGFKYIGTVQKGDSSFVPKKGDIALYLKNNDINVPGHICMWTDKGWCSDFKQKNMIVYGNTNEAHIFRFT